MTDKDESLRDFAVRIAKETGFDDQPQSAEWIEMKAHRIEEATRVFCHYRNGGLNINSCCQYEYRCRTAIAAASRIRFGNGTPVAVATKVRLDGHQLDVLSRLLRQVAVDDPEHWGTTEAEIASLLRQLG